jgi:hypothetical protein
MRIESAPGRRIAKPGALSPSARRLFSVLLLAVASPRAGAQPAPAVNASTGPVVSSAAALTPTPPPGNLESSKIRLDAHDVAGALADAEAVIARDGGSADAFAARADAKRALGRPMGEVLADYAEAAKLDPRYIEKLNGLIAQLKSEQHPDKRGWSKGLGGLPIGFIALAGFVGIGFFVVAGVMARKRDGALSTEESTAPKPDEKEPPADQKPDGNKPSAENKPPSDQKPETKA